jgi:glycosyltransferase involved in cell wall biosynthesis
MKKISLIVPVYNCEAYLTDFVRSVLSQDWPNFQLILSDDGSTDGSFALLQKFSQEDPRITVITGDNRGVSSARNRGLKLAQGDLIGFADADDLLEPSYLSTLARLLEETGADAACCGFSRHYVASGKSDRMPPKASESQETDREGFWHLLLQPDGYTTVVWNKLFRREVLLDASGDPIPFDETLHVVEDGEYLFRLPVRRAVFTPEPLYRYFVRKSGVMYGAVNDRKLTELDARKKIVALCQDASPEVQALARMKYQKGARDLMLHAVIDGQGAKVRHLRPELSVYRQELYGSPALSRKEKLKYRVYGLIIRLNLKHLGAFLMNALSGH